MKVYVAGPMRGLPDFNRAAFNKAAAKLRAAGHEVFNPAELDFTNDGAFAKELMWIIEHAEAIAFLPGWQESRGARAERATAEALNRPIRLTSVDALLLDRFRDAELAPAVANFDGVR